MAPLMRLRKRVFAPRRRAAVERVPPLHFATSAGAESSVLRRGPGRSAWLTPSLWNPPSSACATILMARCYSSMSVGSPKETPPATLLNDRATTVSSISAPLCVTGRKKGPQWRWHPRGPYQHAAGLWTTVRDFLWPLRLSLPGRKVSTKCTADKADVRTAHATLRMPISCDAI